MKTLKTQGLNFLLIGFFVIISLIGTAKAMAATYYVSPNGSDSYSGLKASPFMTIQKAADVVSAGDTVIVKNGTYKDTNNDGNVVKIRKSGNANNWITFKSENKWGTVLDGNNNSADFGFILSDNSSYIIIEGFEFKDLLDTGIQANSQNIHIKIIGNYFHDIGRPAFQADKCLGRNGIFAGKGTSYFTIEKNVFHTIGRIPTGGDCDGHHDHGIYTYADNLAVINNIFYDLQAGWGVSMREGSDNVNIINNTFSGPNPKRPGQIDFWGSVQDVLIQNNIFNDPNEAPIRKSTCYSGDDNITFQYNLSSTGDMVSGTDSCLTLSNNKTSGTIGFVNESANDFHLKSTSQAINAGSSYAGRPYDADGNPVVDEPDIGAYEYSSQAPDPISTCELASKFVETTLSEGMEYYTDRSSTLTSIPSRYFGLPAVKTPNDEKDYADETGYMKFELANDDNVYVAYDCRATSLPNWMSTFTDTGDTIYTTKIAQPCLRVYEKNYSAGSCVDFGANKASGTSSTSYGNYIVFYGQISDAMAPSSPFNLEAAISN